MYIFPVSLSKPQRVLPPVISVNEKTAVSHQSNGFVINQKPEKYSKMSTVTVRNWAQLSFWYKWILKDALKPPIIIRSSILDEHAV